MSNSVVILGNGFDLQCGLKSSYCDFYLSREASHREFYQFVIEKIIQKSKLYGVTHYIRNDNTIHLLLGLMLEKELSKYDMSENNIFEIIFSILSYNISLDNHSILWRDIEYILEQFLCNSGENQLYALSLFRFSKEVKNQISVRESEETVYMVAKLIDFMFSRDVKNADFIKSKKLYAKFQISKNEQDYFRFLLAELNRFEIDLQNYIHEVAKSDIDYDFKASRLIDQILTEFRHISKQFILNFNYTLPVVKSSNGYGSNVHGYSGERKNDPNNHIIIGIDQSIIETSHPAYIFTKTYRKMSLKMSLTQQSLPELSGSPRVTDILVYGHSLSQADQSYFFSIFDFYSIYSSQVKIAFLYSVYDESIREDIENTLYSNVTRLFNEYVSRMMNSAQMKHLQHKLLLENRLRLVEIPNNPF